MLIFELAERLEWVDRGLRNAVGIHRVSGRRGGEDLGSLWRQCRLITRRQLMLLRRLLVRLGSGERACCV